MKILWQNRFDGFDFVRTSPLYYKGTVEKEKGVLKCCFFGCDEGISSVSFDANTGEILACCKDGESEQRFSKCTSRDLTSDDFIFGEYIISHHGEWGYMCRKNGQLLWKKSLKGYLYTEIVSDCGSLIFGTGGRGGHFYSLNIETGEIIFDFDTKGTSKFFAVNDRYYFCSASNKNTQVVGINRSGKIIENMELEGVYHDGYCMFDVCEDLLCVMTLKKKRKGNVELFAPIFNCVRL